MIHFVKNKFVQDRDAKISVFDLTVLRAYGVFDYLRTYNQKPFHLHDHILRLKKSARLVGLEPRLSFDQIEKIALSVLAKNINSKTKNDFGLKIILTGGQTTDGILPSSRAELLVLTTIFKSYPESYFNQGVKLISWPLTRLLPQAKSLVYLNAIIGLKQAQKEKAFEILYLDGDKNILEAATANFFMVKNKKLYTPPDDKILAGVTRKVIFSLAKKLNIPVFEKRINFNELTQAEEAFITASNKEVLPVRQVDNIKIKNNFGPITEKIQKSFFDLAGKLE